MSYSGGGFLSDQKWARLHAAVTAAVYAPDEWEIVIWPPNSSMCTGCKDIRPVRTATYDPWKDHHLEHGGAGRPE